MKRSLLRFLFVFILGVQAVFSQDTNKDTHTIKIGFPQVVTISLRSDIGTDIVLKGTAPTEAGEAVVFNDSNSDIWLNYSCSIIGTPVEPSKSISVQITQGAVPAGLKLSVIASQDAGQGDGTIGQPTQSAVALTDTKAQLLIDGIGVTYTGKGTNKGHNLLYTLTLDDIKGAYGLIDYDQSGSLTITYTLADN